MVEPMQTVLTKKVNWEVRSRAGATEAIHRWAASVPSRRVPFATLGHRVTGEFAPPVPNEIRSHLVRAVSAPQLDFGQLLRERRQIHTLQRSQQALHAYKASSTLRSEGSAEP